MHVEDRGCDEWKRAAYISVNILNANRSKKDKKVKLEDLYKDPREERNKKVKQNRTDADEDTLRQMAIDKGLNPNF